MGNGERALAYLGRYLYRGVIHERDILRCAHGQVTFRYRDGHTGKNTLRTVSGAHFLWLVLQHVLPKGFRRSRNFGLLHPFADGAQAQRESGRPGGHAAIGTAIHAATIKRTPKLQCRCCGSEMVIVRRCIAPVASTGGTAEPPGAAREGTMH